MQHPWIPPCCLLLQCSKMVWIFIHHSHSLQKTRYWSPISHLAKGYGVAIFQALKFICLQNEEGEESTTFWNKIKINLFSTIRFPFPAKWQKELHAQNTITTASKHLGRTRNAGISVRICPFICYWRVKLRGVFSSNFIRCLVDMLSIFLFSRILIS